MDRDSSWEGVVFMSPLCAGRRPRGSGAAPELTLNDP